MLEMTTISGVFLILAGVLFVATAGISLNVLRRISEVEAQQPRWSLELEAAGAALDQVLDAADAKLRRAVGGRGGRPRKADQPDPNQQPQLTLVDPLAAREQQLAQVKARFGA